MAAATALDPNITMKELLVQFPGAQRALFRKYHIGGCSSCGFSPDETLAGVCARNENLDVDEVVEHIVSSHEADLAMQIEPRELSTRIASGEKIYLLDVRTHGRNGNRSSWRTRICSRRSCSRKFSRTNPRPTFS